MAAPRSYAFPLPALFVFAWLALLLVADSNAAAARRRPNLVLIMAEDLSPRLGAYGDSVARTPNLDRLAGEGVRFERAFTTAGVCAPSRAGIIMGVHQNSWGAGHMRVGEGGYGAVPPPRWKAFPELLRAAGYYVVNNGKTDYQMDTGMAGIFDGPFSIWDESDAEDWRGRAEGQPFFAYLTLENTHESQVWPTWQLGSLIGLAMSPMRIANHWQWEFETDPASVSVPPYYPDTATVRSDLARHYNNIAVMDRRVGEILAKLEEDGVANETIVVFATDHGDGLPRAKRWLYDSGIHIPLIVRWPGRIGAATTRDELVSGVDLAPTFLSLAEAPIPEQMQGRVFLGAARQPEPRYVYSARDRIDDKPDTVRAVRDRRFKYIRNVVSDQPYVLEVDFRNEMPMMQEMLALDAAGELDPVQALWFRKIRDPEELYDTDSDPHEVVNLASDPAHAETLERMRSELDRWLAASSDLGLLPEAELQQRFWPGGEQPVTAPPEIAIDRQQRVVISCPTEGASLAVSVDGGDWQLYTTPLAAGGAAKIAAKAVRYGWHESDEVRLQVR